MGITGDKPFSDISVYVVNAYSPIGANPGSIPSESKKSDVGKEGLDRAQRKRHQDQKLNDLVLGTIKKF